jgi:hypothetical protein
MDMEELAPRRLDAAFDFASAGFYQEYHLGGIRLDNRRAELDSRTNTTMHTLNPRF